MIFEILDCGTLYLNLLDPCNLMGNGVYDLDKFPRIT